MSYGPYTPNLSRIRQCHADDGKGNACGLEAGHDGPHGWELPVMDDYAAAYKRRKYFKLWRADAERN